MAHKERQQRRRVIRYIQSGTEAFRRVNVALFVGGFVLFATLYCVQPLLPEYAAEFRVSPAAASLTLSATTGALAVCMLVAGSLSEAWGRKSLMVASLLATSVLTVLSAFSPNFGVLLAVRTAQGVVLAGVPSIAMAYLSDEIEPKSLGLAMGIYISGNSIGGMGGRILTGTLAGVSSWRIALGIIGAGGFLAALWFWRALPAGGNFRPRPLAAAALARSLLGHLRDPGLLSLYGVGFLLMAGFVAMYNYIAFLLVAPPYRFSVGAIGWIFLIYLVGTFSSTWMGRLADRLGRRRVLWVGITILLAGAFVTLPAPAVVKLLGLAILTFGFFAGHSIASSWVGRRATHDKAQASSLYLFAYYLGSSVGGFAGGFFWARFGWPGVVGMVAALALAALALSALLTTIPAVAQPTPDDAPAAAAQP